MRSERIASVVDAARTEHRIPSISLAVANPREVLASVAVGHADLAQRRRATPEDQYLWFSMTKIATATAAMRLHADGVLDLDVPIGRYLPDHRPHPRHGHPTTRQLLTHTAGLSNPMPVRWVRPPDRPGDPDLVSHITRRHGTPRKNVGARAGYSNIGYLLAAQVVEAATGRTVEECVHDAVLTPLGMTATGYRYRPEAPRAVGYARLPRLLHPLLRRVMPEGIVGSRTGAYTSFHPFLVSGAGYGGLVGTATDACRLAAAHVAGDDDPHPVLDQHDIEAMRAITASGKRFDHGIGWFRRPADAGRSPGFVEHYGTGGGFWNAMRIYPEARLAMVAMANTTASWDVDRLFTALVDMPWD